MARRTYKINIRKLVTALQYLCFYLIGFLIMRLAIYDRDLTGLIPGVLFLFLAEYLFIKEFPA